MGDFGNKWQQIFTWWNYCFPTNKLKISNLLRRLEQFKWINGWWNQDTDLRFSKPKQQQAYPKKFIVPRYDICNTVTNYIYNIQATIAPATPPNALTLGDASHLIIGALLLPYYFDSNGLIRSCSLLVLEAILLVFARVLFRLELAWVLVAWSVD